MAQAPDEQGIYASRVFPGLRLAGAALCGDLAAVLAEVQAGLQAPAHEAFVAQLAAGRSLGAT